MQLSSAAAATLPRRDPAALPRLALTLIALAALWPALRITEFNPAVLFEPGNAHTMGRFLGQFIPPATSPDFLRLVGKSTLETLAIANVGIALAFLIAFPLSLLTTNALSKSAIGPARDWRLRRALRYPGRALLIFLRGIPELVWALLFVRAVGLGPTAGVLALAITYGGMLGKVYAEIYESSATQPARALMQSGAGRLQTFFYAVLPVVLPEMVSYTVYRWECAVRASVIMGFVGAGGLGQQLELSMRMLNGAEACTILLTFLLLVLLADAVSALFRRWLA
ncbi:MAG: ABC transporter permease subunit [bacterium]|jgi:phosphonate transport system permease protein